jgi:Fic family protein
LTEIEGATIYVERGAYFEKHRERITILLLKVSQSGEWRPWIEFFLTAVAEQAGDAVSRSRRLLELLRQYSQMVREKNLSPTSDQLVELIFMKPVLNVKTAQEYLKVSYPSAQLALSSLEKIGILTEITGRKRDKAYSAQEILKALDGDTSQRI